VTFKAHTVRLDRKYAILVKGAKDEIKILLINPFEVCRNQFVKVAHGRRVPGA
jgi:hypothetical protein